MGTPLRVLVVEDSADDAELVVRELRRGGYEPSWERVESREAMAEALSRQPWDVIISDHQMPRFSAPAALALVREKALELPFIIVSGSIGEEAAVAAMKAGAHDYLLKERLTRLGATVAREVREAELRRSHTRSKELLDETRTQLDAAMRQLLQAEKMTALGELVAGVAHEINNPLSSILGYTQLLLAKEDRKEVRQRLETMSSEAERMARIVKNLLTFARKHPPERKYLGLNGIIEKTLELKAYHFKVNQIEVVRDLDPGLPKTMLDFHQMQQVILNLLNNAEQALSALERPGTIRVATRVVGGRIEARVSDDGPGIPAGNLGRIFEPFFTTKKEGKGTGLGLSLCYGIMEEHGGSIRAESGEGDGATFLIELPILQDEAPKPEMAVSAPAARVPSLRILVIDDELGVQDFLFDFLSQAGHRVDTASDVPEAIRKIEAGGQDLIISDMKMPHGTGRDIHAAALNKGAQLARRIVFTTGDGASQETRRFLEETGNAILLKPFRIEDIEKVIADALRH